LHGASVGVRHGERRAGSATVLATELADKGVRNKRGRLIDKGLWDGRPDAGARLETDYPNPKVATFCAALWSNFTLPLTSDIIVFAFCRLAIGP